MSESTHPAVVQQRFVPHDRESFLDAQRRNRRATWRLSVLCVLAAVVMGIPLALIITPLLYAVALIAADVINIFSPLPASFWAQANAVAHFGIVALDWLLQHKSTDLQSLAIGAAVMLLPGAILSFVLWLGVNALFSRAGVGGALLTLNAREPNQTDLKELPFADVVQEMAIAAGLPAPRVFLIETPGANAAAIGTSPANARIIVSRRLIDDLSRDELEGALAHLIASIGNGDLRIAFRVTSVFETCGLLVTVINSPFGSPSRRTLWRILRYSLSRSTKDGDAQEAAAVADLLGRGIGLDTDDIDRLFETGAKKSFFRSVFKVLFLPILLTNTAVKLALWFFSSAVLGPSVALLWRTRKYLADASAVQLTRNPDGLAGALQKLSQDAAPISGGEWASHLFIVSPGRGDGAGSNALTLAQKQILAQAWLASAQQTNSSANPSPRSEADFAVLAREFMLTQRAALSGDAQAITRIRRASETLAATNPALAAQIPDPADFIAARQGDRAAIARLMARRHTRNSLAQGQEQAGASRKDDSSQPPGMSSITFLGFHPSMKRRLKRLERMGAHVDLTAAKSKVWIVTLIISVILAPLFLLLIGVLLLLIAMLTMLSLTFLVIWLAVIHKIFALAAHH